MNYIFYHSVDLDGHCSGAAARMWHEDNSIPFTMVPITHGESHNQVFLKGDTIYCLDYILPNILELYDDFKVIVIDHHKTALYLLEHPKFEGKIDVTYGACELAWNYFFKCVPHFVRLLSIYDTWQNDDQDYWNDYVLPFQYGMRGLRTDPNDNCAMRETWRRLRVNQLDLGDINADGSAIIRFVKQEAINKMKCSFPVELDGLHFVACVGVKGSMEFESVWDPKKYDGMMSIIHRGDYWSIGIYTDKDIDLSQIAKNRGGGGHKRAAGFEIKNLEEIL